MEKTRASKEAQGMREGGRAPERDSSGGLVIVDDEVVLVSTDPRWVGTGRTVFDNKGNPVKQYEPYFSSTDEFEDEVELVEQGVTPILYYDPLGRLIRTDFPDGTFSTVEFTPWLQRTYDQNDTAGDSDWYSQRVALSSGDPEREAAESTDDHHDTPTLTHIDPQGRPVRVIADLGNSTTLETRSYLDIQGNVVQVDDARGNTAETRVYGMAGQALQVDSVDAGQRRTVSGALGDPLRLFDDPSFGRVHRFAFDALRRVTHHYVQPSTGSEVLVLFNVYGEIATNPEDDCLRGHLLRQYDGAGLVVHASYDFEGNLLEQSRQLTVAHDAVPDWIDLDSLTTLSAMDSATSSLLDSETFTTQGTFDAFGRPVTRTTPDDSVTEYTYNDAGLLESVSADVRGGSPATDFVDNIDYDVYGRRTSIEYSNGTTTSYTYDPLTFRLRTVTTERTSDSAVMQDLSYYYDAVGNITRINDGAQQTLYFDNTVVTPDQTFTYDAIYRLTEATGREHTSQGQPTESEMTPGTQPETSDPAALRTYTEAYTYDEVGNLTLVEHTATNGNWSRGYDYATDGNQLLSSSLPGDTVGTPSTYSATYSHDDHGNMTAMPHLSAIDWDYADRMQHADLGGGGDVYFQYDAAGDRVRKVQINTNATAANERVYLGGFELYRQRDVSSGALSTVNDIRETLHVADDAGRVVMVETLTLSGGSSTSNTSIARYQYGNHLGTVSLELDDSAAIISYEEFHPYGSSAYRAVDSGIGVSAKRYRYTGKERDEETGLDHMGARYYAPWLGRWTAADPIGLGGGMNRYAYVSGNPVRMNDPTGTEGLHTELLERQNALIADYATASEAQREGILQEIETVGQEIAAEQEAASAGAGRKPSPSTSESLGDKALDVLGIVTIPHQFAGGQLVGAAEATGDLALAIPRLGIGLYRDPGAVGEAIGETYEKEGLLGFTPIPRVLENIGGIFSAESVFEAGRSHAKASVGVGETAAIAVGGAAIGELVVNRLPRGVDQAAAAGVAEGLGNAQGAVDALAPEVAVSEATPGVLEGLHGPFVHQINKGGLENILATQQLMSTRARDIAGGGEAVRAHVGSLEPEATGGQAIEFHTTAKPSVNRGSGVAQWYMDAGEMLDIVITRVLDQGKQRAVVPKRR